MIKLFGCVEMKLASASSFGGVQILGEARDQNMDLGGEGRGVRGTDQDLRLMMDVAPSAWTHKSVVAMSRAVSRAQALYMYLPGSSPAADYGRACDSAVQRLSAGRFCAHRRQQQIEDSARTRVKCCDARVRRLRAHIECHVTTQGLGVCSWEGSDEWLQNSA